MRLRISSHSCFILRFFCQSSLPRQQKCIILLVLRLLHKQINILRTYSHIKGRFRFETGTYNISFYISRFSLSASHIDTHNPHPAQRLSSISISFPFFEIALYMHATVQSLHPSIHGVSSFLHTATEIFISSNDLRFLRAFPFICETDEMPFSQNHFSRSLTISVIIPGPFTMTAVPTCTTEAPSIRYSTTFL